MGILSNGGSHTINGPSSGSTSKNLFGSGKTMGKKCKIICAGVTLVAGILSVLCGILILLFIRDLVDNIIKKEIPIQEGSQIVEVWQKPPITPYLKIYFFNITNPVRFLRGLAKPKLQEVGPFTYQEVWEKVNVTWSDNGTKVTFGQQKTYLFREDLSYSDEDTVLNLLNLPMMTALAAVKHVPESESVIRVALGSMLEILKQEPIVPLTVREILWGYENPLIQLGRGIFPDDKAYPFDEFGLFVGKNGTFPGLITAWTGSENVQEVGQVYAWNDQTELDFWQNGTKCNRIMGTDGSTFHPDIKRDETLYIFNRDLCRALPLVYQEDVTSQGFPGYRFVPPEDIFAPPDENPDNACFCTSPAEEGCNEIPRGLFNMSACQFGSPVLMSWPHFFQADPKLLEDKEGLNPDKEKHQFFIDLQPKLGTGLRAQARSQINIQMYKVDNVKPAEGLRDMVFPFLWFSSGIESIDDADSLSLLRLAVITPEKVRSALSASCIVIGVVLIVSVFIGYRKCISKPSVRTEPITPRRVSKEENGNAPTDGHYEMKSSRANDVLATS